MGRRNTERGWTEPPPNVHDAEGVAALLASELAKRRERSGSRIDAPSFLQYAQQFPTAKGERFDFTRYPFQREIYRVFGDLCLPAVDVMKSSQVGLSEAMARLGIWFADVHGRTALMVFHSARHMEAFTDTRVNPLRERSEY